MNRLQDFVDIPEMTTGTAATIAADEHLTLLAANDTFYTLIGEHPETGGNALLPFLAPEDADTFRQCLDAALPFFDWEGSLCAPNGNPFRVRFSATRMNGVLHEKLYPVYLLFCTLAADSGFTASLPNLESIQYSLIDDISEDLPFEYDFLTDTIVYTPKYREVFGQAPVIRGFRARLLDGEDIDPVSAAFRDTFLSLDAAGSLASPERVPEQLLLTQTGSSRWFALYRTTLYDARRTPIKSVGVLRDIDVQKREQLRLLDKSRTDSMTGLYNKTTTEEEIRIALREVQPDRCGILFMIDIDNFKGVNDSMGHLAGDSIIMETARQLKRIFRQGDIIGRVGGDEFHVYMRNVSDLYSIRERAQTLCSSIQSLFASGNLSKNISISVGIAIAESPIPYEALFHKADLALYQAKGNGKNRYEIFGQETDSENGSLNHAKPVADNAARNNIMVDIIDILFSVNDMREGVDKALEFIGHALHVDKLHILEYSLDRKTFSITHEWCSDPKWSSLDTCRNIPIEKLKLATPLNSNGVYYCSDFSALNPEEKTFLYDKSISSLLQCDITRDQHVVGHICFEERGQRRIWTQQEVDALILMSKLLGEYVRQRQASSLLLHNHNDTLNILNNLPSTAVYVIDKDHRLTYFNKTVAKAHPQAHPGMNCFQIFWNREDICPFCPVVSHGNLDSYTTLLEHSPFPGLAEVTLSKIIWEGKPAHVLLLSEHLQSPEERQAKAKRDSLARALCSSYHYVIDVDLGDGTCELLVENSRNRQTIPHITEYAQYSEGLIQRIAPRYREAFLRYFSLKNLRSTFSGEGEPREIHLEYQIIEPGGFRWRSRVAFAYTQNDGSRHILLCIRDIEEQKQAERARKRQDEQVGIALQNSYAKIYQANLPANRITCLFCNTELLAPIDVTGSFDEDLETVMKSRIHPEDRAVFSSFFNAGYILKGLSKGIELSAEYRKQALDGTYHWMLALIVPVPSGAFGEVMLLIRDVTERKKEENSYLVALQSNYTEIFRLDLAESRISPVYYDKSLCALTASSIDFKSFIGERGGHVHPEHIKAFKAFYDAERVAKQLLAGKTSQVEYRKRLAEGAPYRWINAVIRPIPENRQQALILLQDVTEVRDEEAAFYKVLQSSYTKIYEIMLDADSVRILYQDQDNTLILPELSFHYWADTERIAHYSVHPEDREIFLKHYTPDHIRARLANGQRLVAEYRILSLSGHYHWISSLLLPIPGSHGRLLILCQDINERKENEELAARLQRRQSAVFRQSGDCIIEINLRTWQYTRAVSAPQLPELESKGDYRVLLSQTLKYIHPEDLPKVKAIAEPQFLFDSCQNNPRTFTTQYRLINTSEIWLENRVFFLQDGEDMTAFFLIRDISEQKRLERERDTEEERFNLALRDTYTEIYEINPSEDTSHLLYSNKTVMIPLDENRAEKLSAAARRLIHPEDTERFLSTFTGEHLRKQLEEGQRKISVEYRRIGKDGAWHWTASSVVPLCMHGSCRTELAMLLVRDISEQKEEELRRRISEQYDHALRNIYDELYELNITRNSYRVIYQAEGKYKTPQEGGALHDVIKLIAEKIIYPEDKATFLAFFNIDSIRSHFAKGREYLIGEFRKLRRDETYHWASLTLFPVSQESGSDEIYLIFIMDIGEKKQAEEIAQQNMILERQRLDDERYRTIVEQTDTLVFEWNRETNSRYISPKIKERFAGEYNQRNLLQTWRDDDVIHPDDKHLINTFLEKIRASSHTEMTARLRKRSGEYIWCKVALTCLRDENGKPKRYIGTLNDVDKATQSVLDLKYRAEYDLLTDAYNMYSFYAQTEQLLHAHPERHYSIIRMDIDRFKVINDIYGLKEGDKLLVYIADMLRDMLTDGCIFGRLGGDIFCMCVDFPREQVITLIKKMIAHLASYPLPYKIVPSFGICEVDNINTPINILCDWANLAIKAIKGNCLQLYAFYDGKLRDKILEEKNIENQMHEALLQGQFVLYLQPKVHIPTSRIIGSEGLARWIHPTEGLMPPARFIPLFEKNGFILRLDEYIWEQACITLRRWIDLGFEPSPISVNMSRLHIHDPHLRDKLLDLVRRYDIPPRLLELEVTESALLENENSLFQSMQRLKADGFLFSMDDFGSGYSSLNMLKSMPVDVIKIDRGFLNEVAGTERGKTVIRFSIALAKEMNIKVIAEGVESEKQAAFLLQAGCAYAQGYFYSKPLPVPDFERLAFEKAVPFPVAPSIKALSERLEEK